VKRLAPVINFLAYQCAWFACVIGAAAHRPAIGLIVVLGVIVLHLCLAAQAGRELRLIGIAVLAGAAFETLLAASGWVRAESLLPGGRDAPLWMVALWAGFATTLNVSLRSLRRRYLITAALAAVGAPLAYLAGARLGALHWVNEAPALLIVALGWGLLLPLLMKSAQRFDGFATT
jgi:hypothetical protein